MGLKKKIKDLIYCLYSFLPTVRGRAVILMYHTIGYNNIFFNVTPEEFKRQMQYLKDNNFNVIGLGDLVGKIAGNSEIGDKTVIITFDDGYEDNYINAFPVLKEFNYQATIFINSGLIGKQIPNSVKLPQPALSWDMIKEMHDSKMIDFEPHTVNHKKLTEIPAEEAEVEISDSKIEVERNLNKICAFFAYPSGKYDENTIEILKKNNFKSAVTINNGAVKKSDSLYELPRNSIDSKTTFNNFKTIVKHGRI